jgi:cytochrome b561
MTAATERAKPRVNSAFKQLMSVHWWMAALYGVLFCTGTFMSQLPREVSFRGGLYDFHKSIGVVTLALLTWRILVLLRVWWRKYTQRFPKLTPKWWQAVILHSTLYGFMWAVPLTGFFLSNSFKTGNVKFFGLLLPDLFPQNSAVVDLARSSHFWTAYIFLAFIGLHAIAQWKVVKANWRRFTNFVTRKSAATHKS